MLLSVRQSFSSCKMCKTHATSVHEIATEHLRDAPTAYQHCLSAKGISKCLALFPLCPAHPGYLIVLMDYSSTADNLEVLFLKLVIH